MSKRAVFLDRDGVLNEAVIREGKPYPPASAADMRIVAEAPECLKELRQAGFLLIVVTNQPDLARKTQTKEAVEEIHLALQAAMPIDAFYVCAHDGPDGCACRKPKAGLLKDAARDFEIDLGRSFIVGDRWRDVDAGSNAGCRTVFLDFGYSERAPDVAPSVTVGSLRKATDWILKTSFVVAG